MDIKDNTSYNFNKSQMKLYKCVLNILITIRMGNKI